MEIDESKIISHGNDIISMFGMIDRYTKEARVFCVMNNRTKENLLPIIKNNINTTISDEEDEEEEEDDNNEYNFQTRIYSDCFSSYQTKDFREIYIFCIK